MKKLIPFLFLLQIFFLSCSSPTGSNKNDTGSHVLATVSIGPAGGVLKAEQVTVTVPNGAFTGQSTVSISTDDNSRFGTSAASTSYLIDGIPVGFSAPITVSIECSKVLTGDVYISIGTDIPGPVGDTVTADLLYPATVSGTTATCTIPPGIAQSVKPAGARSPDYLSLAATALNDYLNKPAVTHFTVIGPKNYESELFGLAAYLENIRSRLEGYGFSFNLPGNMYNLNLVQLEGYWKTPGTKIFPIITKKNIGSLWVNLNHATFPLTDAMRLEANIRLTNLLAQYYCLRTENLKTFLWFDTGVSYWLGNKMASTKQNVNPLIVLKGIPDFIKIAPDLLFDSCYNWLLLIEYFDNQYGLLGNNHLLANIYADRNGGKTVAESIARELGTDETTWWPEFVKEYIGGNIYGIPSSSFLDSNAMKGTFTITATDTTKTFSSVFGDLSADIYRVSIDPSFSKDVGSLQFTAESNDIGVDYLNVLFFGIKGGKLEYIGQGNALSVNDLIQHTDNNEILAVVTNSKFNYPFKYDNKYTLKVTAFRKNKGYSISGTIIGADNVTVTLSGSSTAVQTVNNGGTYSFNVAALGTYTVTPSKNGYVFTPPAKRFDTIAANQSQNFEAKPLYTISGTITGADNVTVTLSGSSSGSQTVNSGVSYSFLVEGGGSYTITPSNTGYTFTPSSKSFSNISSNQIQNFTASVKTAELSYTNCEISIHITTKVLYPDKSTYTEDRGIQYTAKGSFKNGVFTAEWDTTLVQSNTNLTYVGTLTVTVDPKTWIVGKFTLTYYASVEDKRYNAVNSSLYSAEGGGSGIQLKPYYYGLKGEIDGIEVGNYLSKFTDHEERSQSPNSNSDIIGLTPTSRNQLSIYFSP
jgi:hypothetical protein